MGYLDNLENSLKNLESAGEADPAAEYRRREQERAEAAAVGPWADRLRSSDFTRRLLDAAALESHSRRAKLHIAWIGNVLRLDLRNRRLELRPTPAGIEAAFLEETRQLRTRPLDLASDPQHLLHDWLA